MQLSDHGGFRPIYGSGVFRRAQWTKPPFRPLKRSWIAVPFLQHRASPFAHGLELTGQANLRHAADRSNSLGHVINRRLKIPSSPDLDAGRVVIGSLVRDLLVRFATLLAQYTLETVHYAVVDYGLRLGEQESVGYVWRVAPQVMGELVPHPEGGLDSYRRRMKAIEIRSRQHHLGAFKYDFPPSPLRFKSIIHRERWQRVRMEQVTEHVRPHTFAVSRY